MCDHGPVSAPPPRLRPKPPAPAPRRDRMTRSACSLIATDPGHIPGPPPRPTGYGALWSPRPRSSPPSAGMPVCDGLGIGHPSGLNGSMAPLKEKPHAMESSGGPGRHASGDPGVSDAGCEPRGSVRRSRPGRVDGCGGRTRRPSSAATNPQAFRKKPIWRNVINDQFNGTTVPSHWFVYNGPYGSGPENCASPSHVTVSGGRLKLLMRYERSGNCGAGWYTGGLMIDDPYGAVDQRVTVRFRVVRQGVASHYIIPMHGRPGPPGRLPAKRTSARRTRRRSVCRSSTTRPRTSRSITGTSSTRRIGTPCASLVGTTSCAPTSTT